MRASTRIGPFPAPHKTRQFWTFVTLVAIALSCAPLVLLFLRTPLPPFHTQIWIKSAIIAFLVMMPVAWVGFRFGRVAWFLIGVGFLVWGIVLRSP